MTSRLLAILLAASALTTTSCAVVAIAAVGGVIYSAGDLKTDLDSSIFRTIDAVNESFDALNFQKTGQETIQAAGSRPEVRKLFAPDTEGRPVKVTIKPATPFTTNIAIRVGVGKKEASQKILDSIKSFL